MKKTILIIVIVLIIVIALFSVNKSSEESISGKPVIKIGVALSLTGVGALYGAGSQTTLQMAIDKIKTMDTKYNYNFIIEDAQIESSDMVRILNKLMTVDKVPAILSIFSKSLSIAKNYADQGKFLSIGCSWGDSLGEGLYNFNGYTSSKISASRIVEEMFKRGYKNIALLGNMDPGSEILFSEIKEEAKRYNMLVSFEDQFQPTSTDFAIMVGKMKQKEVDIIVVTAYAYHVELIIKEMKMQGLSMPMTSVDTLPSVSDRSSVEGQWFISYLSSSDDFQKEYKSRTKLDMQECSIQTYNNTMILVEAFENAPSIDIRDVATYINNMGEFEGVNGTIKINEKTFDQLDIPVAIIKNGKIEILEE